VHPPKQLQPCREIWGEEQKMNLDITQQLQQYVQNAFENTKPLAIVGGNSKSFYGHALSVDTLDVSKHQGVISYEPTELVITARAGTPLADIEKLLHENGQMLGFEPPAYAETATLGGTVACNFSGPRRVSCGAARDFLLGSKIINGKAEILRFGGEVMKNVAGYDVSRLMAGAMGTLGVLLELSLKVLPRPESEITRVFDCTVEQALQYMHDWGQKPYPISSTCYHNSHLHVRLSGSKQSVVTTGKIIGGEVLGDANRFWFALKEHQLDFFKTETPLWRLSLASDIAPLALDGEYLYEWGGALRWLKSNESVENIQATVAEQDGHALCFRSGKNQTTVFQPLPLGLKTIHKNLKQAFDPKGILNPGRMYSEF